MGYLQMLKPGDWGFKRTISQKQGWKYRIEGMFDLEKAYREIWAFLRSKTYDIEEYDNTTKKKDRGDDVEVKFRAKKEVDDYVQYHLEFIFYVTHASKVNYEGKTLTKGKLELSLKAYLLLDYQNKWKRTKFARKLHNFYHWYLIKWRIDKYYETGLFIEFETVKGMIKDSLGLFY
ncbi:MAG: hypothetical protein PHT54_02315 [Candidatus Nanoarchaeia archaeon]|nr:hypothetical protein [Candidatus Nanoarchaeia archaeon]